MARQSRRQFVQGAASVASLAAAFPWAGTAGAITETPVIKVGQIGVGHAHASKLATYRRSPDYEVVGIVEPDAQLRERAKDAAAYRGLPWMTQEQLLNVPGLQAVLVETQVRDLLPAAAACVAAGKHVHLDKPAGESLEDYRQILDAAARQKLIVQMGYMYRYNPAVVLLRDFLAQGWLGEVFEVHAVMSKVVGAAERQALAQYRGGIMFELGCHIIDLAIGVLGRPTGVQAFAKHSSPLDDALQDNMLAVLDYPLATATVKSSALEVDGGARRHFVVCGSEGTFHIQPLDNPAARIALSRPRGTYRKGYQDVTFPKFTRYIADAADMARAIRGERKFAFTKEHDLAVQETVLRASGMLGT